MPEVLSGADPLLRSLERGDATLAVHTWGHGPAELLYVHGLQSHAGWLSEAGPELAARGVRLSVLDRRGSGRSTGQRGHLADAASVLDDYAAFLAEADAGATGPLTVVGQSFGGSILAALLATGRVPAGARIVLCAPALGQQRARLDEAARAQARQRTGTSYSAIRLHDEQYTDLPRYLRTMANDGLMVRMLTDSFRAAMIEIEDLYMTAGSGPWAAFPVHVALPQCDAIIDLDASRDAVARLAPHAHTERFATTSHYLEFTDVRRAYWDWLAEVARAGD
ncbi:alpha/beta fold hydrolase [Streptomyces sp. NPDC048442]|uniref:alpha/beta hydrolase n=1 Tax=Streptomyces sp. NPDC048442 TaxID=3154823 RepID=UPI003441791E